MPIAAEQSMEHIGETSGMANHDRDLVNELGKRLDCVWRCDQYIANADGHDELRDLWRSIKQQDLQSIERMRSLVRKEIENDCF